jgi:hypothetical protein
MTEDGLWTITMNDKGPIIDQASRCKKKSRRQHINLFADGISTWADAEAKRGKRLGLIRGYTKSSTICSCTRPGYSLHNILHKAWTKQTSKIKQKQTKRTKHWCGQYRHQDLGNSNAAELREHRRWDGLTLKHTIRSTSIAWSRQLRCENLFSPPQRWCGSTKHQGTRLGNTNSLPRSNAVLQGHWHKKLHDSTEVRIKCVSWHFDQHSCTAIPRLPYTNSRPKIERALKLQWMLQQLSWRKLSWFE